MVTSGAMGPEFCAGPGLKSHAGQCGRGEGLSANLFAMLSVDRDEGDGLLIGERAAWVGLAPILPKKAWPSNFDMGWAP